MSLQRCAVRRSEHVSFLSSWDPKRPPVRKSTDPWADPKSRSTLGLLIYTIAVLESSFGGIYFSNPPGGLPGSGSALGS